MWLQTCVEREAQARIDIEFVASHISRKGAPENARDVVDCSS
jgi:hypothetical protein